MASTSSSRILLAFAIVAFGSSAFAFTSGTTSPRLRAAASSQAPAVTPLRAFPEEHDILSQTGAAAARWLAATTLALLVSITGVGAAFLPASAPAHAESAAPVKDVTGFAEFAKKGGAMDVNPSCFVTDCGKQTKECFVEDARCLKGALCLARCRGDPDCATQCFAEFGCPRLDNWLNCTVEKKQCVSVPEGTYDVKKYYETDVPVRLKDFDVKRLEGLWYKVRGYNAKYDCYPCQTNKFKYNAEANTMQTEVKLRLERKKSGGFQQTTLTEQMKVGAPDERYTLRAKGEIFGLTFEEEWYVLGADEDFVLVAYTGNNLQDAYKGGYVYAKTPVLSPEVAKKAQAIAEKNGFDWSKYCSIDNACPAQPAVDYSKNITLGWDDVPDLIEWFAPGTTRGGTVNKEGFNGEYK